MTVDGFKISGWDLDEMPPKYINQNAIVFSNDQDDSKLEELFYEKIKSLKAIDFPNDKIEFVIDQISINIIPEPIGKIPYPFSGIGVGIAILHMKKTLFVRFNTIHEKDYTDEKWDKKWTMDFYFNHVKDLVSKSNNMRVNYTQDDYLSLEIEIIIPNALTIEDAVNDAILILDGILKRTEYSLNGLNGVFSLIDIWNKNKHIQNEDFWRTIFKNNSWVLSVALNEPTLILENEAFLGGKSISNGEGRVVDFLYKNNLSKNVALIEIKKPQTKLLGSKYRGVFSLSVDLTGAINQLLDYRDNLHKNFFALSHNSNHSIEAMFPKSYLIIGSIQELNSDQRRCFELYRRHLMGIELITFDELFEKLFFVLSLLNKT